MFQKLKQRDKTALWAGICVVTALFFMLLIYAPVELYCYNIDEFWFDLYELMPMMAIVFLGGVLTAIVVLVLMFCLLPRIYRMIVLPFCCITFLCTYVQGNFLVGNLPSMDGFIPEWNDYSGDMLQSAVLWVVVTLVIAVVYRLLHHDGFAKAARLVSVCMTLMLAVTMCSVLLTTEGYRRKMDACSTTKDQYVFSEDQNFIILVLDSVDAGTLSAVMEEKPEYQEIFEDFTYYANMMGAYPCTEVAVPNILSGVWYENERTMKSYEVESYNESPLLYALEEEGYKLGMYEYEMPYADEKVFRFSNVLPRNSRVRSYVDFAKLEIKLVGYRYAPFWMKEACLFNADRFATLLERNDEEPVFFSENKIFYDRLNTSEVTTVDEKCFKFIRIDGAHVPFQYDENLNVIENGTYADAVKAAMTITEAYLNKLKESGVYDNSVIVIMADHGFAADYGFTDGLGACEGRQNPIFFAKGLGEHHTMQISQAPVSYVDLQEAFTRLLEGRSSEELFDYQEGDVRERRYIYYDFVEDTHMYEYTSEGHASDRDAMVLTGNEYIRRR